jgi:hypothetical protein
METSVDAGGAAIEGRSSMVFGAENQIDVDSRLEDEGEAFVCACFAFTDVVPLTKSLASGSNSRVVA